MGPTVWWIRRWSNLVVGRQEANKHESKGCNFGSRHHQSFPMQYLHCRLLKATSSPSYGQYHDSRDVINYNDSRCTGERCTWTNEHKMPGVGQKIKKKPTVGMMSSGMAEKVSAPTESLLRLPSDDTVDDGEVRSPPTSSSSTSSSFWYLMIISPRSRDDNVSGSQANNFYQNLISVPMTWSWS